MARASIKRNKKRYRFLTRLTAVCFTFVMIAIMLGALSPVNIAVNSAFESGATPLFSASKFIEKDFNEYKYKEMSRFSDSDYVKLSSEIGKPFAKHMELILTPRFGQKVSETEPIYPDYYSSQMGSFGFSNFNGVLEGASATELGLTLVKGGGTDKTNEMNEIVISDLAANEFIRYGYVGENASAEYGIHTPAVMSDLIGCKISIDKTDLMLKIVGIYETNYANYKDLSSRVSYAEKTMIRQKEFDANKNFLYGKIFAKEGFSKLNERYASSQNSMEFNVYGEQYGKNAWYSSMELPRFVPMQADRYLWMKGGEAPTELAADEIVISHNHFAQSLGLYGVTIEELKEHIDSPYFTQFIDDKYGVSIFTRHGQVNLVEERGLKIVGIYVQEDSARNDLGLMMSDSVISTITSKSANSDKVYFNKGNSFILMAQMSKLEKSLIYGGSAKTEANALINLESAISMMRSIFVGAAIVFLILCFLITFYYMSTSVKFRTKEIAVYRVVGAKSWDVARIFLAENLFAAIKTTIWASIFTYLISNALNTFVMAFLSILGVGSNLVTFTIFTPVLIFVIAFAFLVLSSLIPIIRLVSRKPVDAMKMV